LGIGIDGHTGVAKFLIGGWGEVGKIKKFMTRYFRFWWRFFCNVITDFIRIRFRHNSLKKHNWTNHANSGHQRGWERRALSVWRFL